MPLSYKKEIFNVGSVALNNLNRFISYNQTSAIKEALKSEEGSFFTKMMVDLRTTINTMPKTYEQDGKGDNAIAYLHYFRGGSDFYITERDMEVEQSQAYGLANFGYGNELGYVSITELILNDVELDLYFEPTKIGKLRK